MALEATKPYDTKRPRNSAVCALPPPWEPRVLKNDTGTEPTVPLCVLLYPPVYTYAKKTLCVLETPIVVPNPLCPFVYFCTRMRLCHNICTLSLSRGSSSRPVSVGHSGRSGGIASLSARNCASRKVLLQPRFRRTLLARGHRTPQENFGDRPHVLCRSPMVSTFRCCFAPRF